MVGRRPDVTECRGAGLAGGRAALCLPDFFMSLLLATFPSQLHSQSVRCKNYYRLTDNIIFQFISK
jgi:hypothetical protein